MHSEGSPVVKQDNQTAFQYFKKAADKVSNSLFILNVWTNMPVQIILSNIILLVSLIFCLSLIYAISWVFVFHLIKMKFLWLMNGHLTGVQFENGLYMSYKHRNLVSVG